MSNEKSNVFGFTNEDGRFFLFNPTLAKHAKKMKLRPILDDSEEAVVIKKEILAGDKKRAADKKAANK